MSSNVSGAVAEIQALLLEHPRSSDRWIGLEVERFAIKDSRVLSYEGDIEELLKELSLRAWKIDYEVEGKILALSKDFHQISLEPGSQFEIGLAPAKSVFDVKRSQELMDSYLKSLRPDWKFWGHGLNPWDRVEDRKLLPSPRYHLMNQRFEKTRGREMMRLSCGLQINLDYSSEQEGVEMMRAGFLLAPYLSALFVNSPYEFGRRTNTLSERAKIWENTDRLRSGFPEFVWCDNFSLKMYAEEAAKIPLMYAYDEESNVFDPAGKTFLELPDNLKKVNALSSLRQIFTEVRFKPCCVELRFFDQVPANLRYAATALSVGLLYSEEARTEILKMSSYAKRLPALQKISAEQALHSDEIYNELCKLVRLAKRALLERKLGEENFLAEIERLLSTRKSPAELLIDKVGERLRREDLDDLLARPEFAN